MGSSNAQTSEDFFGSIGSKVEKVAPGTSGQEGAEDDGKIVEEIESLCMNCHENGTTRMLLTSIPYFREIIIMSFSCDACHFSNNEVQPAGSVQPRGSYYELRPTALADLGRQVVKSDTATVRLVELDLEIPPGRGRLTNVEGLLSGALDDLELGQEARREQAPEAHAKIAQILRRGRSMLAGEAFPFRLVVDDPAGNSFVTPDLKDGVGKWEKREYARTAEQNEQLGLSGAAGAQQEQQQQQQQPGLSADGDIIPDEVYSFPATCPGCSRPCTTNMKMVDIPHFKQVVLMSVACDGCGFRSNEVKTGGEIPERGERITLRVRRGGEDLSRDILKSETCAVECPELRLAVSAGTLGGRFTTVEGLLTQVRDDLRSQIFEADGKGGASSTAKEGGDSLEQGERERWRAFFDAMDEAISGSREFTMVLSDPLASSYVQALVDPPDPDPQMTREMYDRTEEEEEELGLRDMKVEGYEGEDKEGVSETG